MKIVCTFKFRNPTPGALRYDQVTQDGETVGKKSDEKIIGTLYLRKAQVDGEPQTLTVTIETP